MKREIEIPADVAEVIEETVTVLTGLFAAIRAEDAARVRLILSRLYQTGVLDGRSGPR